MSKILIVSVGGSCSPVVTAIEKIKPERIVFFCSGGKNSSVTQVMGEGKPCVTGRGDDIEKLPNILVQTGWEDKFDKENDLLIVSNPDNLRDCYNVLEEFVFNRILEDENAELIADYTGGTKTMSAALATVAVDFNFSGLFVTTALRDNLSKITVGQVPRRVGVDSLHHKRRATQMLPVMIKQYYFSAAVRLMENILFECDLPGDSVDELDMYLNFCMGFEAWDRFDHRKALEHLKPLAGTKAVRESFLFLKKVINSRFIIDEEYGKEGGMPGHKYEVIEDLLLNAKRRAFQGRYDDAVGRVYRAMELLAQLRLKLNYNIITGNVDLNNPSITDTLREKLEKKKNDRGIVQIALRQSYELLYELGDPVGKDYAEHNNKLMDSLKLRNDSLFAHGFNPLSEADYKKIENSVCRFIERNIEMITGSGKKPEQFPIYLKDLWVK
ncbi:MAG: TIGR02710 family CRISPR-associated CARF protein [Firmicutes bacterium]|nr:TIGR02710 family CRISPR-associated CARF protein [Bacillota bacterium]